MQIPNAMWPTKEEKELTKKPVPIKPVAVEKVRALVLALTCAQI
jgi:hypothetical protein